MSSFIRLGGVVLSAAAASATAAVALGTYGYFGRNKLPRGDEDLPEKRARNQVQAEHEKAEVEPLPKKDNKFNTLLAMYQKNNIHLCTK